MKFAIVTEYYEGSKIDTVYTNKGKGVICQIYINGEKTSEYKVYKVKTDKPYTRWNGRYFYISDEYLEALRTVA